MGGSGKACCQLCRLTLRNLRSRHVKIPLGRGFNTDSLRAEYGGVEIELQDSSFRKAALQLPGQHGLFQFASDGAVLSQPEISRQLLGDRRGAPKTPARHGILHRCPDLVSVEATVREESEILRDYDRELEISRDGIVGNGNPRNLLPDGLGLFDERCRLRFGLNQVVDVWGREKQQGQSNEQTCAYPRSSHFYDGHRFG